MPAHRRGKTPFMSRVSKIVISLTAARNRSQLPDELDNSRTDRDEDNRRQNKDHQRGNHLNRSFCCLFFGTLPAFRAEGVRMHPESLSHARAEAIRLDECT